MARNSTLRAIAVESPPPGEVANLYVGSPFQTKIGVGQVIKGWDEGVPQMSLGERATLTITPYVPCVLPEPPLSLFHSVFAFDQGD